MAISIGGASDDDVALSQINTTPLVDVMLVLLIIFLITIPVVTTSVPVRLPKERVEPRKTRPDNIVISVDRADHVYWFDTPLADDAALLGRLKQAAARRPAPEIQIRGDMRGRYAGVGRVIADCQRAGIVKVTFVTEPGPAGT